MKLCESGERQRDGGTICATILPIGRTIQTNEMKPWIQKALKTPFRRLSSGCACSTTSQDPLWEAKRSLIQAEYNLLKHSQDGGSVPDRLDNKHLDHLTTCYQLKKHSKLGLLDASHRHRERVLKQFAQEEHAFQNGERALCLPITEMQVRTKLVLIVVVDN